MSDNKALKLSPEALRSLEVCCALCAQLLREPLTEETLDSLRMAKELLLEEPFLSLAPQPASLLHQILLDKTDTNLLAILREDYTYLFSMTGLSQISPYESVYRTEDRTLFGPTTLWLRELMLDFGVSLQTNASEPEDHIAIEFAFLAELLSRLADDCESGDCEKGLSDEEDSVIVLGGIRALLAEHLLGFGPIVLEKIAQGAKTVFYREVAHLSLAILEASRTFFAVRAEHQILWD